MQPLAFVQLQLALAVRVLHDACILVLAVDLLADHAVARRLDRAHGIAISTARASAPPAPCADDSRHATTAQASAKIRNVRRADQRIRAARTGTCPPAAHVEIAYIRPATVPLSSPAPLRADRVRRRRAEQDHGARPARSRQQRPRERPRGHLVQRTHGGVQNGSARRGSARLRPRHETSTQRPCLCGCRREASAYPVPDGQSHEHDPYRVGPHDRRGAKERAIRRAAAISAPSEAAPTQNTSRPRVERSRNEVKRSAGRLIAHRRDPSLHHTFAVR